MAFIWISMATYLLKVCCYSRISSCSRLNFCGLLESWNLKHHLSNKRHLMYRHKKRYAKHTDTFQNSQEEDTRKNEAFFGFERVSEEEKAEKVHSVFSNVASRYDLMNDVMSGGLHRLWKDYFIQMLSPTPGTKLLDVAGGTGDIAFRFLKVVHALDQEHNSFQDDNEYRIIGNESLVSEDQQVELNSSQSHVIVFDINHNMLKQGMKKAQSIGYRKGISWVQGDAEELPFPGNSFDAYTCAFGIRNMVHIEKALDEAHRVLKPGGRFMCLEFSHVTNPVYERVYDWYSFQIIPVLGQLLAQDWRSYQYLVESIRKFPDQEDYQALLEDAGFHFVTYENLLGGITAIHTGFKL